MMCCDDCGVLMLYCGTWPYDYYICPICGAVERDVCLGDHEDYDEFAIDCVIDEAELP